MSNLTLKDMFPSRYFNADDFDGNGQVLTIKDVTMGPIGRNNEIKPLVWFLEAKKALVLNVTNGKLIAQLYGENCSGWVGKKIALYTSDTPSGGFGPGVRVRMPPPSQSQRPDTVIPEPPEPPDPWA